MRLTCTRTDCSTGAQIQETHTASIKVGFDNKLWVEIHPGVTGYESASVSDLLKDRKGRSGWSCCAGTPNRYDKLFIPESEMDRLLDMLRLLPNTYHYKENERPKNN